MSIIILVHCLFSGVSCTSRVAYHVNAPDAETNIIKPHINGVICWLSHVKISIIASVIKLRILAY